jgi:rhamnosyltransferase
MSVTAPRISVIIPTLNGAASLPALLAALARARARHSLEIVAIDSGSRDATLDLLAGAGARVLDLGGEPFGHATARNRAAAHASGEVLLFLTQDVEPVGEDWLEPLLAALAEPNVAGAFGRQVPRGASPEEAFLAGVNYGAEPRRLTSADLARPFGPGRTFFSSAFGAVRREAWARIPFPSIVMSEDQAWAMAVLRAGQEIRYVPEAAVYHGHDFGLVRAFRRNFDSGSSLAELGVSGGMWSAGLAHLTRELRWVMRERGPARLPYTLLYEAMRMAGFQCGRLERVMPRGLARRLGEAPRA